ncbi:hypothetical protein A0J61_07561 [Choanephora cucurbitarum]|uniref:Uncharacterized protein n=1 Tax=Choanephora cucurbitarum TaxID=101091 RepID=A0A1C7N5L0_9FUNG|nr:hypothetical protein A0J61_07561 [Choanephora cucurbitarum]
MIHTPNFSRRVSFDLSHNVVYVLPTLEECRDAAKQKSREEWQRRSINEDLLNEDIIAEIQEDCYSSSRDSDEEECEVPILPTKSCLKKPPTLIMQADKKKKSTKKHQQKKRKRFSTTSNSHE